MVRPGYQQAFSRLEQLVEEMESDRIGVDELVPRLKEAAELVGICKAKLHDSEKEVKKILDDLSLSFAESESGKEN